MDSTFRNKLFVFLAFFFFLFIHYELHPFVYGSATNVEDIPVINKFLGYASYNGDIYVDSSTRFNQLTPYISCLVFFAKMFSLHDYLYLFYFFHLFFLLLLFIGLRKIHKLFTDWNEFAIVASIFLMMFFIEITYLIPADKWVFYDFLDQEFVTLSIVFLTFYFYTKDNIKASIITQTITTLFHPLYGVHMLVGILGSTMYKLIIDKVNNKKSLILQALVFTFITITYSFIVWLPSHQTVDLSIDASSVLAIVRSAQLFEIPIFTSLPPRIFAFYLFTVFSFFVGIFCLRHSDKYFSNKVSGEYLKRTLIFVGALILYLFFTSLISTFVRIPFLVQLNPYRIGAFTVPICWIIQASFVFIFVKQQKFIDYRLNYVIMFMGLFYIIISSYTVSLNQATSKGSSALSDKEQLTQWIKNNTKEDDLFLNYTDLDLRTKALRPEYFRFHTIPYTANAQIEWYKRYYAYFDIPETIKLTDYVDIREYAENKHLTHVANVLKRSEMNIDYVLIAKNGKPFSEIEAWLGLSNDYSSYDLSELNRIYENEGYEVYNNN